MSEMKDTKQAEQKNKTEKKDSQKIKYQIKKHKRIKIKK